MMVMIMMVVETGEIMLITTTATMVILMGMLRNEESDVCNHDNEESDESYCDNGVSGLSKFTMMLTEVLKLVTAMIMMAWAMLV